MPKISMDNLKNQNYDMLIKVLQAAAIAFMIAMLVTFVVLMKKYNISVRNVDAIADYLTGGVVTVATAIIVFMVVKSFALVVTPSVSFIVSGVVFEDVRVAVLVNVLASAIGLILPFYLGKFTGRGMAESLKKRFPKVKKFDDFAGENEFFVSFMVKAANPVPGDLSSLILGAMDMSFSKYFIGGLIGTLPLCVMWAFIGHYGDLSDPFTILYVTPVGVFAVIMAVAVKIFYSKKNRKKALDSETTEKE